MQNRPTREELLRGVAQFLKEEAVEQLEGRAKFQARVAARAVEMVLREMEGDQEVLNRELESLQAILGLELQASEPAPCLEDRVKELNSEVVDRIQRGEADDGEMREALVTHLKRMTLARLAVNNPKMVATVQRDFGFEDG